LAGSRLSLTFGVPIGWTDGDDVGFQTAPAIKVGENERGRFSMKPSLPPVAFFGKLPAFGDFVRFNAGGSDFSVLDQWFQEGLYLARKRLRYDWNATFDAASGFCFHFRGDRGGGSLVGVFHPSQDRSGRKFPFILSTHLKAVIGEEAPAFLIPAIFGPFLESADALIRSAKDGMEMQMLTARTRNLAETLSVPAFQVAAEYRSHLNAEKLSDLWLRLWGNADDERKYNLLGNWVEVLSFARRADRARMNVGLCFPLPAARQNLRRDWEVCFWLEASLRLLRATELSPVFFWNVPEAAGVGKLFVFFRQPSATRFLHLIQPEAMSDTMWDLVEARGGGTLPGQLQSVLENTEARLSDLLHCLDTV
jgi:type VI secretion system protein ImpM